MMDWVKAHGRSVAIAGTTVLIPLLVLLWALDSVLSYRADKERELDRIEPRLERLVEFASQEEAYRAAIEQAESSISPLVFDDGDNYETQAATWQRDVREFLVAEGLEINDMRIISEPPASDPDENSVPDPVSTLRLNVTTTGEYEGLIAALESLSSARPVIFIERIELKSVALRRSRRRNEPEIDGETAHNIRVSLQLAALRVE